MTSPGDLEASVRAHFRWQSGECARLGSPFNALLLEIAAARLSAGTPTGARVLGWRGDPHPDALGLRFAGTLHGLVLAGQAPALAAAYPPNPTPASDDLWMLVEAALTAHAERVDQWLDSPPQTNEVGRSIAYLVGLSEAARRFALPLALYEIGSSAGLNLQLDQFHFDLSAWRWGGSDAAVRLAPEVRGAPPEATGFDIASRAGCDLAPIDPSDPAATLRLRAYCWPDQTERLARLEAAIALAAASDIRIAQADAADWVAAQIPHRPAGVASVLLHSVMWRYLPAPTAKAIETLMAEEAARATSERPLAWLQMEDHGVANAAVLRLSMWPKLNVAAPDHVDLAHVDYHGRWIDWRAPR